MSHRYDCNTWHAFAVAGAKSFGESSANFFRDKLKIYCRTSNTALADSNRSTNIWIGNHRKNKNNFRNSMWSSLHHDSQPFMHLVSARSRSVKPDGACVEGVYFKPFLNWSIYRFNPLAHCRESVWSPYLRGSRLWSWGIYCAPLPLLDCWARPPKAFLPPAASLTTKYWGSKPPKSNVPHVHATFASSLRPSVK